MSDEKIIVVIDDEDSFCELLRMGLEETGKYKVYTSTSPSEGIKLVEDVHPDLVILDVMMPEMHGFEVLDKIRLSDASWNTPVLFLTSLIDPQGADGAQDTHRHFMTKPSPMSAIIAKIESLLANPGAPPPPPPQK